MDDEDDERLWQRFSADIKPLKKPPARTAAGAKARPAKKTAIPAKPAERIVLEGGLKAAHKPAGTSPPQLDRRTEEKLRKGKMAIDATLDLHGLSQARAQSALTDFIAAAQARGKRYVLVITGKGLSAKNSAEWMDHKPGILKQRLPQWLAQPPLDRLVLKHYPAQPAHGGSGALYVYLKRDRALRP